jgi:hypothetical protein
MPPATADPGFRGLRAVSDRLTPGSGAGDTVLVMSGAPVHILGWDDDRQVWLARRDGEPSFSWVQSFADAYLAACVHREVDLIVPAAVYEEWVSAGNAPQVPLRGVVLSPR